MDQNLTLITISLIWILAMGVIGISITSDYLVKMAQVEVADHAVDELGMWLNGR